MGAGGGRAQRQLIGDLGVAGAGPAGWWFVQDRLTVRVPLLLAGIAAAGWLAAPAWWRTTRSGPGAPAPPAAGEDGAAGVTQDPVAPGEQFGYRFRADQAAEGDLGMMLHLAYAGVAPHH